MIRTNVLPLSTAAVAAVALATPAPARAQGFEGTVEMRVVTSNAEPLQQRFGTDVLTLLEASPDSLIAAAQAAGAVVDDVPFAYAIKGQWIRAGASGARADQGYMILKADSNVAVMVQPQEHAYVVVENKADSSGPAPEGRVPGDTVAPLGLRRTILGQPCEAYRVESAGGEIAVVWVAPQLRDLSRTFARFSALVMGGEAGSEGDTGGQDPALEVMNHGFPMVSVGIDTSTAEDVPPLEASGTFVTIQTVTAIHRGAQPDSLFSAPARYDKLTLDEMFERRLQHLEQSAPPRR